MFAGNAMMLVATTVTPTTMEFPGLGIGEFSIQPVAFSLFNIFSVRWYGIIIMCGIVAAFLYALYRSKQEGVDSNDLMDLALAIVPAGIVGARAWFVLTTLEEYDYSSFLKVIAIWEGGLGIYGGVIAGIIAAVITCRVKKINPLRVLDMVAPGVMLAQSIGRWGNFCNGEAFGGFVQEGNPLYLFRMGLISGPANKYLRENDMGHLVGEMQYYHPTFLYESLWNIVGFTIITLLYRKKKFQGQILLYYLTWYGFGRFFIEGLRTDSLYIPGTALRISQVVGAACFVLGAVAIVTGLILQKKGKLPPLVAVTWAAPAPAAELADSVAVVENEESTELSEAEEQSAQEQATDEEPKTKDNDNQEENNTEENQDNGDE